MSDVFVTDNGREDLAIFLAERIRQVEPPETLFELAGFIYEAMTDWKLTCTRDRAPRFIDDLGEVINRDREQG